MTSKYLALLNDVGISYTVKGNRAVFCCPFHSEKTASCSMYTDSGFWRCFGCGASGNATRFASNLGTTLILKAEEQAAIKKHTSDRKPLPSLRRIYVCNQHLNKTSFAKKLENERLISISVANRAQLGLYCWGGKFFVLIPFWKNIALVTAKVWNAFGVKSDGPKIWAYTSGYGTHPYPNWARAEQTLLVLEGEGDTLAAWSVGIPAITLGGASMPLEKHLPLWQKKRLFLCYDRDPAGYAAEERNLTRLTTAGVNVKVVDLKKFGGKEGEDFTDVLKREGSAFVRKIKETLFSSCGTSL